MATAQTTGLDYTQTLYRLIRFMGERVEVQGFDRRFGGSFIAARGVLRGGVTLMDYDRPEPESIAFILAYGGFLLNEGDFLAAETIGDNLLRIEQRSFMLTVAIEQ
jgi:hypothetical protein